MRRFIDPDILFYLFLILVGIGGFSLVVVWPRTEGFYAFIACAALGGLGVTGYIYYAKRFRQHLACPSGSDCNAVVNSRYSKFLGIPLEYLGSLYYFIILVSYAFLFFQPALRTPAFTSALFILTGIAFLFSLYLIFIQAFILRQWCIWCLLSAALSITIFLISLGNISFAVALLGGMFAVLAFTESLGFVLGMGGATAALFLFFKFIRSNFDIDDGEASVLHELSELIWLGLVLTFMSLYAQYAVEHNVLATSPMFLVRMAALFVVAVSGAVLNLLFAPVVSMLPFHTEKLRGNSRPSFLVSLRVGTILTGAISLASWYFAFVLQFLPTTYSLGRLLVAYSIVLIAAIAIGDFVNRKLS